MRTALFAAVAAASLFSAAARANIPAHPEAEAQALSLAEKAIALRSVRGPGNETPKVAELYKSALVAGGWADADVTITPVDDTAYLIATWPGSDPSLKPLVISGHMDVVEAKPADWKRDPFTPVVENGYLFGRGASDMKYDGTLAIASLIELRREGYKAAPHHHHPVLRRRGDDDEDQRPDRRQTRQRRPGAEHRRGRRHAGRGGRASRCTSHGRGRRRPMPTSS